MSEPVNPHGGPYDPRSALYNGNGVRRSVGPFWDKWLEIGRQSGRSIFTLVCGVALADYFLFAAWLRHGEGRVDVAALGILAGLCATLAGFRSFDLSRYASRP